jgi:phosphopantetheinyl transferase
MPELIHLTDQNDTELRIWHIEEDEVFFRRSMEWPEIESEICQSFHPKRRLEYLASRYLLYRYLPDEKPGPFLRDEFGKLLLRNGHRKLSISHSGKYTGYAVSNREMGMDLQVYDPKILRILGKFLDSTEQDLLISGLHREEAIRMGTLAWCAKEAVYKAHGRRGILFSEQIRLHIQSDHPENLIPYASLSLPDQTKQYRIRYEFRDEFIWLLACLQEDGLHGALLDPAPLWL